MSKDLSKGSPDGCLGDDPWAENTVERDWRLQINKPDPVIPMGREISISAGAKSGNKVGLAGAKNAWVPPLFGLPLVPSAVAVGTCQAEPGRHSWPEPDR